MIFIEDSVIESIFCNIAVIVFGPQYVEQNQ